MEDLVASLPPEWAAWLRVIAEVSFALSLLAAAVKPMLGTPDPERDPVWKQRVYWIMHAVDFVAVNTVPIRAKDKQRRLLAERDQHEISEAERLQDEGVSLDLLQRLDQQANDERAAGVRPDLAEMQRRARQQRILKMTPEERRAEQAGIRAANAKQHQEGQLRGLVAFALLVSTITACAGPQQVRTHATLLKSVEQPFLAVKQIIETRMASDAQSVRERVADPEAQRLEMAALRASYAPIEAGFETFRQAYNAYVDAIKTAHKTGGDIPPELALALLSRWQAFADIARDRGIAVPQPPDSLRNAGGVW